MIFYILVIAVLNLGVGFAVACYVGRQYRNMLAANDPWDFDQAQEAPLEETQNAPTPSEPLDDAISETPPDVDSPDVDSPDVKSPDVESPDVESPDVESPDVESPDVESPDVKSPDVDAATSETLEDEAMEALTNEDLAEARGVATDDKQAGEEAKDSADSPDVESPDVDASDVDVPVVEALEGLTEESLAEVVRIAEDNMQVEEEAKDGGNSPSNEPPSNEPPSNEPPSNEPTSNEPPSNEPTEGHAAEMEAEPESKEGTDETGTVAFRSEVVQYQEHLKKADSSLRSGTDQLEAAMIEEVLSSLRESTEQYITDRNQKHESFETLHQANPEFDGIRTRLKNVTQQQDEQIADVNKAADAIDYETGLEERHRRMLHETSKLLGINDQLRDELDEAILQVARSEEHLGDVDLTAHLDPLTQMPTRVGLELILMDLWKKDPQRSREICGVLIDLDQFGRINEEHGRAVGDRTLETVAQAIQSEDLREGSVLARVAGQQFFLLLPDADTRAATNIAEHVRQIIDVTRFQYRNRDVAVSVSCGVAMAEADDTPGTLLERLRTTLKEAKRYGRNRTFLYEGQFPTPVVPPSLSLTEKQVPL